MAISASLGGKSKYVVTSAQNATPVNKKFLSTLLGYCHHNDAQLVVIPYRYRNPTSMWSQGQENDDWWAPELAPYLFDQRADLGPNLTLLADIKTQPTAVRPLSGFETMTGMKSAIIGHPKLEMITVATPQNNAAKILTTTGAVTDKNYIAGKAGKKAEFHHVDGACIVEFDGEISHLRQVNALEDGSFADLGYEYSGQQRRRADIDALICGDVHVEFVDQDVARATFTDRDSIVNALKPREIIWHDVLDFFSGSHHHKGKVFVNLAKHNVNKNNVERELDDAYAFIDRVTPPKTRNVIVSSNHHDHLSRWINETDPRYDLENCVFWARTFVAMAQASKWTPSGPSTINPFEYWAKQKLKCIDRTTFLGTDESHMVGDIEVGSHGHDGPDGARGSRSALRKVGAKMVIGHSHSPGITDGVYQVGTSSLLRLGYVHGPSSWMHCHCIIYRTGKRSLIFIQNGKWRA